MANVGTAPQGKVLTARGALLNSGFLDIGSLSGLTNHGVIVGQGTSAFVATAAGVTGQVLTGVTGGDPIWAAPAVSNDYHDSRFIVGASSATGANYTTIASAITAAVSAGGVQNIAIQAGTYTENLTHPANINLVTYAASGTPSVTIVGKITCTDAGSRTISGIRLQTNSDNFLAVTGTAATVVKLKNCYLNCSNNTGISHTSSDAGSEIWIEDCVGNYGTTGITMWVKTSAGIIRVSHSDLFYGTATSTPSSNSASQVVISHSRLNFPLSTSSGGVYDLKFTSVETNNQATTCITTAGTGVSSCINSYFTSDGASALSIGSGTTLSLYNCVVDSSNTNAITGSGTLLYGLVTFQGSSSTINTSTQTPKALTVFQGGTGLTTTTANSILYSSATNVINQIPVVNSGILVTSAAGVPSINGTVTSWTPVLSFGGASVGITYNAQQGGYYQCGQVFFFDMYLDISNKGSSTGTAAITGLPAISPARTSIFCISANSLTFSGQVNARVPNGTSTISLDMWASGGGRTALSDTAFANGTYIQISGQILLG